MKLQVSILSIFFSGLLLEIIAQNTDSQCPKIQCVTYDENMEPDNLCLLHSGDIPATDIKLRSCQDTPNHVCDLVNYNKFAWPNVTSQFKSNLSTTEPNKSPLFGKQTAVKCVDLNDLYENNLNNGRNCLEDYQCLSRKCDWDTGKCVGRLINETCKDHSQCNFGLSCQASRVWPFATTCQNQLPENSTNCTSDWDCHNNMGCIIWIDNRTAQVSRCTKYYSLNDNTLFSWNQVDYSLFNSATNLTKEAILFHGKFCKSGIANRFSLDRAQCVSIDTVKLSNDPTRNSTSPFECRADGTVSCSYQTGNTRRFSLPCECGFDGSVGYCPIPDTAFMQQLANYTKSVYDASACHTLDRHNMIAQRECGLGQYVKNVNATTRFSLSSDYQFQLKYWTFTRTDSAYNCMNGIFPMSKENIMASAFIGLNFSSLIIIGFLSTYISSIIL
eukprot:403343399